MKITQIELNTYSFYRHIARFLQDCHKSKKQIFNKIAYKVFNELPHSFLVHKIHKIKH